MEHRFSRFVYLYRLRTWENKLQSIRPLGYVVFAYLLSVHNFSWISILNLFAVSLIILSAYIFNDYYDWNIRQDWNYLYKYLREHKISKLTLYLLLFTPIILSVVASFLVAWFLMDLWIGLLLLIGGFLGLSYSIPPLRLKDRRFGPIIFPIASSLLFLESLSIYGAIPPIGIIFTILVFLFQSYLEALHLIADSLDPHEIIRLSPRVIGQIAPSLLVAYCLFCLFSYFYTHPVFILGVLSSMLRFRTVRGLTPHQILKQRRNIWSPLVFSEEFVAYGIWLMWYL